MRLLLKFSLLGFTVVVLLLLVACIPASAPGGINCKNGVCVEVQLSQPIRFNEPGTVTITVETEKDEKDVQVGLGGSDPDIFIEGPRPWTIDTKAHQPVQITRTIRFPAKEGRFDVYGDALTYSTGAHSSNSVYVFITRAGGTVNPIVTRDTGTPLVAPTAPGSHSPLPTPPGGG